MRFDLLRRVGANRLYYLVQGALPLAKLRSHLRCFVLAIPPLLRKRTQQPGDGIVGEVRNPDIRTIERDPNRANTADNKGSQNGSVARPKFCYRIDVKVRDPDIRAIKSDSKRTDPGGKGSLKGPVDCAQFCNVETILQKAPNDSGMLFRTADSYANKGDILSGYQAEGSSFSETNRALLKAAFGNYQKAIEYVGKVVALGESAVATTKKSEDLQQRIELLRSKLSG